MGGVIQSSRGGVVGESFLFFHPPNPPYMRTCVRTGPFVSRGGRTGGGGGGRKGGVGGVGGWGFKSIQFDIRIYHPTLFRREVEGVWGEDEVSSAFRIHCSVYILFYYSTQRELLIGPSVTVSLPGSGLRLD